MTSPRRMAVEPRRCALRFKPPTLVLLYFDNCAGKQRRRSMPLCGIDKDTSIQLFASGLQKHPRHSLYFQAIPTQQLCSLLQRVKDACLENQPQVLDMDARTITSNPTTTHSLNKSTDTTTEAAAQNRDREGWKASVHVPDHSTSEMISEAVGTCALSRRVDTTKSQLLPIEKQERSGIQWKIDVQAPPPVTLSTEGLLLSLPPLGDTQCVAEKSALASPVLDDVLGPVVEEQNWVPQNTDAYTLSGGAKDQVVRKLSSAQPATTFPTDPPDYSSDFSSSENDVNSGDTALPAEDKSLSFKVDEISSSEKYEGEVSGGEIEPERHQYHLNSLSLAIPEIITGDNSELSSDNEQDLNKVSEQILARTKETMDVVFEANCVHPGEEGWQYDRQQEFSPDIMEGGWDSDSSSTQEF